MEHGRRAPYPGPEHLMIPDIREILKMLPHRYPFLLIDRILDLVPGESIAALKSVTAGEPFLRGHLPEAPSMPPELIVEGMAQAGGVLAFSSLPEDLHGMPVFFIAIDKVQAWRPVLVGEQLIYSVRFLKKSSWAVKFAAVATVEGSKVCEAELMAAFGRKAGLHSPSANAPRKP